MTDAMRARVCPERRTVMVYKTSNRGVVCQQGLNSAATSWPQSTDALCMHCVHRFDGPPVPIPREYNSVLRAYVVYGIFCSLSCAAGWISERYFPDAQYQRVLLGRMAREVMDVQDPIESAPAQERLAIFGGDLDIDRFRGSASSVAVCHGFIREPPFVRVPAVLEEHLSRGADVGLPGILCKGVASELETVEEEAPSTASCVVPRGGTYAEFLAREMGARENEAARWGTNAIEVQEIVKKKRKRAGAPATEERDDAGDQAGKKAKTEKTNKKKKKDCAAGEASNATVNRRRRLPCRTSAAQTDDAASAAAVGGVGVVALQATLPLYSTDSSGATVSSPSPAPPPSSFAPPFSEHCAPSSSDEPKSHSGSPPLSIK